MRLFFGFKLSTELVSILSRTQARLLKSIPDGFAPAKLEQLHLTLHFVGERPHEELSYWTGALTTATSGIHSFEISLAQLSAFPHPKDPRVVWAGIRENSGTLLEIVERLRKAAEEAGCEVEAREFAPHLTLGRNKIARNSTSLRLFLEREKLPEHRETISSISLYESTPTPSGHLYSVISETELGAS